MIAVVKANPNQDACTLRGLNNGVEFRSTARRWFLYQYMFPRGDGCHSNLRERVMRGGDNNNVHILPVDDSPPIR
jgi:hypothetical protein